MVCTKGCEGYGFLIQEKEKRVGEIIPIGVLNRKPKMGSCFSVGLKIESSRLDGKVTSASIPPSPRSQTQILQYGNLKPFSFNVLKQATRNFRPDSVLGEGGFGSVFKGWIDEQSLAAAKPGTGTVIAVKRLNQEGLQGHQEWLAEINYLGLLNHPNLVKLIGYCIEDDHRMLVYEFMPRGSLENHLFRRSSYFQPLSWNLRIKVALGAAKGLAYLHSPEAKVIYRDFKSSNILIDSNYSAKLSDFGLAKDGPVDGKSHVSTRVMGTYGYAAPEYMATEQLQDLQKAADSSRREVIRKNGDNSKPVSYPRPAGSSSGSGSGSSCGLN
ncbi:hypothetical protein L1987_11558 [Smallanthus sonchifolius]|uniref:Uncharacterized protein n=1 Tax=Smallanthus sonchifolius TaxID=185202 RepID=A0ACB9JDY5_9ASTR|nr:hypothetical protein L1987_11558 [Smallanthus sonchifolius]